MDVSSLCQPVGPTLYAQVGQRLRKNRSEESAMGVRGWVYIISNQSMPDLIKIGFSTKDPKLRAMELNNTGSPHAYVVEYDVLVTGPREVEQKVHKELRSHWVGKEWFNCSIDTAISAIHRLAASVQIAESLSARHSGNKEASQSNNKKFAGPIIQVRCNFCGDTNEHPDSHIVFCPRCKRSIFTRNY